VKERKARGVPFWRRRPSIYLKRRYGLGVCMRQGGREVREGGGGRAGVGERRVVWELVVWKLGGLNGGGATQFFFFLFPFFFMSFLFFLFACFGGVGKDTSQADRSQPPVGLSASGNVHGRDWLQNQTHPHRRTGRTSHAAPQARWPLQTPWMRMMVCLLHSQQTRVRVND